MKLNLIEKTQEESKVILVNFGKKELQISEDSQSWNTESINKFLIEVVSGLPEGEKIELIYDDKNEDDIYLHIVDLFSEFTNELNKLI
ncbi:MAG: hypothetical protein ACRC42_04925 [Mycoplasma sp.]